MALQPNQLVYLAGPMTGKPAYNFQEFRFFANDLELRGFRPVTPFEANNKVWRRPFGRDFDPFVDRCDYGDPLLKEMLDADIALLCSTDAVALLPGWKEST